MPNPIRNWDESGLPPEIMAAIQEKGYKMPSPIQAPPLSPKRFWRRMCERRCLVLSR